MFSLFVDIAQVELLSKLSLEDLPYVIPALRVQQRKLDFVSDTSCLPASNPFAQPLEYAARSSYCMEHEAAESEGYLRNLITKVATNGSLKNGQHWLEDDASKSFFEFSCVHDEKAMAALKNVELMASKSYNPNGVISISIYYGGNFYLVIDEGNDNPLLDSKFPDISTKGHGYHIQSYPRGLTNWPQLRKMSVWHVSPEEENSLAKEKESVTEPAHLPDLLLDSEDSAICTNTKTDDESEQSFKNEKIFEIKVTPDDNTADPSTVSLQESVKPYGARYKPTLESNADCAQECGVDQVEAFIDSSSKNISEDDTFLHQSDAKNCNTSKQKDEVDLEIHANEEESKTSIPIVKLGNKHKTRGHKSKRVAGVKTVTPKDTPETGTNVGARAQSLGAFHHLAPLKKTSKLEEKLREIGNSSVDNPAWDSDGRPRL